MTDSNIYRGDLGEDVVLDTGTLDGYRYAIISLGSHPCAYVEIPEGHPYRQACPENSIRCHGGITYSRAYAPPALGLKEKKSFWLGWDYAHFGDYMVLPGYISHGKRYSLEEIQQDVRDVIAQLRASESN